jgi:NADPH2:quinone reductase
MTRIPTTMRAAAIDRLGGPEVLTLHTLPVPEPQPRDVLIALHTAGVGSWDAWMREHGRERAKTRFPFVLGTDGAGLVAAVGSRVRRHEPGDRVYAYDYDDAGFYAQYVAVPSDKVGRVPPSLDLRKAGAIPTVGLTALQGIDDVLHVRKGESIIIYGASGGVGSLAVQFAKWRGARVLGTASGKDGLAFVRRLGADEVLDHREGDVPDAVRQFAPEGVDALLALASGDSLQHCIAALRPKGRVAYPNGVEPMPPKRRGMAFNAYDAIAGVKEFDRLGRAVEASNLKVPIAAVYPLAEAARAHERIEQGHVLGKVVLKIR